MKEEQTKLTLMDNEISVAVLRAARIVAMTTTGAAKFKDVLKKANAQICVVEEAA